MRSFFYSIASLGNLRARADRKRSPVGTFWALCNKDSADAHIFVLPLYSPLPDMTYHDHGGVFFPFFGKKKKKSPTPHRFAACFLAVSFLTFLPPHHLACAIPVTVTNSRCREMDEQIRLMDQNLKCLSAAEEKVLTVRPTKRFHVWFCSGLFLFLFCSCLPSTGWFVECFLISPWNAPYSPTYSASFISFLVASPPLHRVSPSRG